LSQEENYIFGIRAVMEAARSGKEIEKILIKKGLSGELFQEFFNEIRDTNIPFQFVPIEKINRVTRKNHQGVVAFVSEIEYKNLESLLPIIYEEGNLPLFLILDRVSDVRNFGSIARSAECAGVDAIIIPDHGAAQLNSDAVKTSAGALHKIPVCRTSSLKNTIIYLKNSGLQIIAATEKASDLIYNADFKIPCAIILGSEDTGVSADLLRIADRLVKIPILGDISSLNVSVAAALLVYEAVRQRSLEK
jgi:23S rRNA (guanosine2251-2'-O)-methyltransferase